MNGPCLSTDSALPGAQATPSEPAPNPQCDHEQCPPPHTHIHTLMGFLAAVWGVAPWLVALDLNAFGQNSKVHLEDP